MKRLNLVLVALLVAVVAAYVVLGATAPEPDTTKPTSADSDKGYAGGALPDDGEDAVDVAVDVLPLALGYDYRTLDEGLDKATALMTKDFGEEFRRTFEDSAAQLATDKEAVTSATVRSAGLVRVDGDRVSCLLYVDQLLVSSATVTDEDNPVRVSQNRVLVGVTDVDGTWLVSSIQPF